MRQRNAMYKLDGDVQIANAYLGVEKTRKTSRGGQQNPFCDHGRNAQVQTCLHAVAPCRGFVERGHKDLRGCLPCQAELHETCNENASSGRIVSVMFFDFRFR